MEKFIKILKDLEMPLKEIKKFIDSRTPDKTVELFSKEKTLIQEKINHLKRIQKLLDVKLNIISEAKKADCHIKLEEHEEEKIVLSDKINDTNEEYDISTFPIMSNTVAVIIFLADILLAL